MNAFDATPARQSLARELTPTESALAEALESIFASGQQSMTEVAAELQRRGVTRPSGASGAWTMLVLTEELQRINASLDAAYTGQADIGQP